MTRSASGPRAQALVIALLVLGTSVATLALPRDYSPSACPVTAPPVARTPVEHLFFIVKENHAFSNYFATFPGVEGNPPDAVLPYTNGSAPSVAQFPLTGTSTPDLPHDRTADVIDLNGGRNDQFVAEAVARGSASPNDSMGYYTARQVAPYFAYAENYSLSDHFFAGVLGPTLPNRLFDIAASSGGWTSDETPPASAMGFPTLLDQLNAAGLRWSYYYTGQEANLSPVLFPSLWGDPCHPAQVLPLAGMPAALAGDSPPSVAFIDPSHDPIYSEHPPENVSVGADWTASVVNTIFESPIGSSSAVFLFFDENGGYFDPVAPPALDALGDGFRIPLMVLSPWTPHGIVVHDTLDPAALLRFADENWGLSYLNGRVQSAGSLDGFFRFDTAARAPLLLPTSVDFGAATANASHPAPGLVSRDPFHAASLPAALGEVRPPTGWWPGSTIWGAPLLAVSCLTGSSPSIARSKCSSSPRARSWRSR